MTLALTTLYSECSVGCEQLGRGGRGPLEDFMHRTDDLMNYLVLDILGGRDGSGSKELRDLS